MLPLLAFLAFVWFERSYLQIIFYDFTNQLERRHSTVKVASWWVTAGHRGLPRLHLKA